LLKGTTKIELIDTRNNKKKTYEKHNMFTNGIQELLSYNGIIDNNKFESNLTSTGQENPNYKGVLGNDDYNTLDYFTGGVLLFSDYINESEDQLQIPKDNKIVGRACLENNESTQSGEKNGSFINGFYSNKDSYSQVWEFNEAQAVGNISSVALTNPLGAVLSPVGIDNTDITYENKYPYNQVNWISKCDGNGNATNTSLINAYMVNGDEKEQVCANYSGYGFPRLIEDRPATFFKDGIVLVDGKNNCLYTLSPTGRYSSSPPSSENVDLHNIKLNKYRLPFTNFSIFDNRDIKYKGEDLLGTVTLQIPQEIDIDRYSGSYLERNKLFFSNDDSYLYVYYFNYGESGTSGGIRWLYSNYKVNSGTATGSVSSAIFKFSLSDFSFIKYWNISSPVIGKNLCSWTSCYEGDITAYENRFGNFVKDMCVFKDKLYFFGKPTETLYPQEYVDLVLYCYDLDNEWIKEVKFNGQSIKIRETENDQTGSTIENNLGTTKGSYDGYDFALGAPFVSMINSNDALFITFLCNGKTFVINNSSHSENTNEIAYVKYKNKINNPFWLDEICTLDEPIPLYSKTILFLHHPTKENLFYIVGTNNLFFKSKSKFHKTMDDTDDYAAQRNTKYKYTTSYDIYNIKLYTMDFYATGGTRLYRFPNDYGCYDIIYDPTILITINNLNEPVQKTDYQRMRVTYTITEVLE
jgi:hypothetical protein